jgi:hypothetical protein
MTDEMIQQGDTGSQTQASTSWTAGFKDAELAKHPSAAKFKDAEAVFKSYTEAEKRMGGMVSIPKEGDVEGWNKFHAKMGVPDSADKYEFEEKEFQGMKFGKEQYTEYAKLAKEIGLTQKQVKALADFDFARQTGAYDKVQKQNADAENERKDGLVKQFGDKYEGIIGNVKKNIEKFADDENRDILLSRVEKDPALFKLMANISSQFSEDTLPKIEQSAQSVEDARTEYMAMLSDKNSPLHNTSHPDHARMNAKHMKLFMKFNGK